MKRKQIQHEIKRLKVLYNKIIDELMRCAPEKTIVLLNRRNEILEQIRHLENCSGEPRY